MLPALHQVRADVGARPVGSAEEFLRGAPLMLVVGGEPFEYPHRDWGDSVQMIGACSFEPAPASVPDWLGAIDRPIVLASTSSERQGDVDLALTAMRALADDPVHVVATFPAGVPEGLRAPANATVREFAPHRMVLQRAVCAVTHGGMGATLKALACGVPVCAVPYGRDQFEVARRVEVAGCGTRLPGKKLTVDRLRVKVHEAMTMTAGRAASPTASMPPGESGGAPTWSSNGCSGPRSAARPLHVRCEHLQAASGYSGLVSVPAYERQRWASNTQHVRCRSKVGNTAQPSTPATALGHCAENR
jgi:hypothetical protein